FSICRSPILPAALKDSAPRPPASCFCGSGSVAGASTPRFSIWPRAKDTASPRFPWSGATTKPRKSGSAPLPSVLLSISGGFASITWWENTDDAAGAGAKLGPMAARRYFPRRFFARRLHSRPLRRYVGRAELLSRVRSSYPVVQAIFRRNRPRRSASGARRRDNQRVLALGPVSCAPSAVFTHRFGGDEDSVRAVHGQIYGVSVGARPLLRTARGAHVRLDEQHIRSSDGPFLRIRLRARPESLRFRPFRHDRHAAHGDVVRHSLLFLARRRELEVERRARHRLGIRARDEISGAPASDTANSLGAHLSPEVVLE